MSTFYQLDPEFVAAGPDGQAKPPSAATTPDRLPLPWLLFLLVFAAWWPGSPWWQSDDFIAIHYTQDFGRALQDFVGNQVGLEGLVWFYRPMITLSFAIEQAIGGGPSPLLSHLSNGGVHALSSVLVGLLSARFLGGRNGFLAGLLWGLMPTHANAIFWAVGRTSLQVTFWMLLATVLSLRALDRNSRATGVLALLAGAAALCSKESAMALPGIVALSAFAAAPPGRRLSRALRTWPFVPLVALYLGLRVAVLGRLLGGYVGGAIEPLASAGGLGSKTLCILDPLLLSQGSLFGLPPYVAWLGLLPAAIAIVMLLRRRRFGLLAGLLLTYLGLALPTLQFWGMGEGLDLFRYLYLPSIALAMLLGAGGWPTAILAALVMLLPSLEWRRDWQLQHDESRAMHQRLLEADDEMPQGAPFFVAGIRRSGDSGTTVGWKYGLDRLLRPPFVAGPGRALYALRPLSPRRDALRLPYDDELGLPFRSAISLGFTGAGILSALPPPSLPDLELELHAPERIDPATAMAIHRGEVEARILIPAHRANIYRVTLFTGSGYITALVPDRGADQSGAIELRDLLHARDVRRPGKDQAHVAFALAVPIAIDLEPTFPVLVEAGALNEDSGEFEAHLANRQPLLLSFDRSYTDFILGS